LERLSSAATTSNAWGLIWSFDGFGNRLSQSLTKGTGPVNVTLVDGNTNRISSAGYSYDANGNMTNMPQQSAQMIYDSSNRMVRFQDSNGTEGYQYAPDNKRVWKSAGCTWYNPGNGIHEPRPQLVFYSVFGKKMGEYCVFGSNAEPVMAVREYVYFGVRMVGRTGSSGNFEAFRTDRLHSNQDAPGGGFFPYGETKSGGTMTGESFATYTREAGGLDYADQRWYASGLGRFLQSDPYHSNKNIADPSGWNRFAYVNGDPANYNEPPGLYRHCVYQSACHSEYEVGIGDVHGGGAWHDVCLGLPMLPAPGGGVHCIPEPVPGPPPPGGATSSSIPFYTSLSIPGNPNPILVSRARNQDFVANSQQEAIDACMREVTRVSAIHRNTINQHFDTTLELERWRIARTFSLTSIVTIGPSAFVTPIVALAELAVVYYLAEREFVEARLRNDADRQSALITLEISIAAALRECQSNAN
jgi:RHS repeat-associated protein